MLTLQVKIYNKQENMNVSTYREVLKEKILSAAMTAFATKGIKAVKMDDIANSLSISKRTLYEIYENKEDLLFEGVKRYNKIRQEEIRLFASGDVSVMDIILHLFRITIEQFRYTNPLFYSDLIKYPKIMKYFEDDKKNTQKQFLEFLYKGISEGYFRDDVNYELIIYIFDVQQRHIMISQLYKTYSMEEIFYNLIFVSLRGICTNKGVEILDNFLLNNRL